MTHLEQLALTWDKAVLAETELEMMYQGLRRAYGKARGRAAKAEISPTLAAARKKYKIAQRKERAAFKAWEKYTTPFDGNLDKYLL